MVIRRLSADDPASLLHAAGSVVQAAYFALEGYPRDPHYDEMLGDVATRAREADVVVALDDHGEVVGCLTFVADHTNPHAEHGDPDAASFRYFGVASEAAGRGVGAAMVQWCVDEARHLGRARLRIHTLTMMHAAQRLYARMGFVRDPQHDEDWDGIAGLAYRLDL